MKIKSRSIKTKINFKKSGKKILLHTSCYMKY